MISADPADKYDRYGFRIENWELYKPKKYYTEPENEEELKKKLDSIENEIRQFKYFEDIPRIHPHHHIYGRGIYVFEEYIWGGLLISIVFGNLYSKLVYGSARTKLIRNKYILGTFLGMNMVSYGYYRFDPRSQPQNNEFFGPLPHEKKIQYDLDLNFDLYRNVDKLKYTDKHITDDMYNKKMNEIDEAKRKELLKLYKESGYKFIPKNSYYLS